MIKPVYALTIIFLMHSIGSALAADITISKAKRTLLYQDQGASRTFRIALGSSPTGAKSAQGDRKTPEGIYFVTHKNAKSQFYLSLGLSYPNLQDAQIGLNSRRISQTDFAAIEKAINKHVLPPQGTPLGGDIFIHGGGTQSDWTWGCIALSNADLEFLFKHVQIGDKVTILK